MMRDTGLVLSEEKVVTRVVVALKPGLVPGLSQPADQLGGRGQGEQQDGPLGEYVGETHDGYAAWPAMRRPVAVKKPFAPKRVVASALKTEPWVATSARTRPPMMAMASLLTVFSIGVV